MILAPILFLQVPLRSSSDDLIARGNLTIIGAATRRQKILHEISRAPRASTRRLDSSRASTRRHAPPRASTRCHAPDPLADVSPSDVIIATSFADVTATSSTDVIIDQDVDQIVDFDR